jgi:UDP-N-acetylmuramoyl-tripeptide--D-alanyl-D-alanine ligase
VGKTTTKDITKALLSSIAPTVAPIGSFNNNLGLPLTALKVDEKTRYFVAEMGANHLGEIRDLTAIAPPDVSLVLKVGTAHLGEFGSVENIFIAKSEIVEALSENGIAILNSDDANVARMAERTKAQVRWFGLDAGGAHEAGRSLAFSATDISVDDRDRPSFTLLEGGEPAGEIHLSLSGQHNVMNALAAISIATTLGLKLPDVVKVLNEGVSLSPHRMALSTVQVPNGGSFTLVDDSFNANPDSMKAALDGFMHTHPDSYHMAVLGPMLELGSDSVSLHSQVGAYAVAAGVRTIIVVGLEASEGNDSLPVLAQALTDGAREEALRKGATDTVSITTVSDLDTAADAVAAIASSHPDTVVLLKGSHASGLGNLAQQWTQDPPQPSSATAMTATDGE